MALRRYNRTRTINEPDFGRYFGTSQAIITIRNNIRNGLIRTVPYITKENERLDIIAGKIYGSGRLWWVVAAGSSVGWATQIPPGTQLNIPNLEDIAQFFA